MCSENLLIHTYIYIYVCVCVCVCVWRERERERERKRKKEKEREKQENKRILHNMLKFHFSTLSKIILSYHYNEVLN